MPTEPSSPICPVLDQLVAAVDEHRVCGTDLLTALSGVPDPCARRGVRHQMATILGLALCAVLAGARSFTAIGEWAANASPRVLSALGSGGCSTSARMAAEAAYHNEAAAAIAVLGHHLQHQPGRRRKALVELISDH